MKFSNGCWLQQEGCECHSPKEVYFTTVTDTCVKLLCPTVFINHRGDCLGSVNLTLLVTSPMPDVIRVRTFHYKGDVQNTFGFDLAATDEIKLDVVEGDNVVSIKSGNLTLEVTKKPFAMRYLRDGELITASSGRDLALMKTQWKGLAYDKGDDSETYMRQMLSLGVDEKVYGTGERFTPFIKNGQSIDIWNEDGGTSTSQSYKNIPFYITNKGYGVLVNHPEKVSFEVGTEMVTRTEFSVEGGYLDYFLINGPSMKEVLTKYTDLTGKPTLPAPWTFGLWLSTSFTTSYDEDTVMSFIDGMLDRGIPLRTFHFDCFWMKEFHWTDFVWDKDVFPDPKGMLSRIKAKGLNICCWINPYIGQESVLFDEGMEKGYFVKRTNGNIWQWDMWQPGMALVDFSNPAACQWFKEKLGVILDMGVDSIKTDFGERIPTDNVVFYNGVDPKKMHNYYTYLYNKCVYELLEEKRGKGEACLFARSATVGGQKFPVHWGGDCWSDYESMEESLRGGLSLLMSGFGYWAHDIGGFENTSTADVYKRWVAFGLLSSHSRLHGSHSYRVPWVYDDEAVDVVRFFTKFKAKLMPYLYKISVDASRLGIPTMRAMVLEFIEDPTCHYLDKQYMLGDNLLVAPIFNDKSEALYYLPKGTWTNMFTGEEKEGSQWIKETHDYLSIPLMVKENSIVILGNCDMKPDYDYSENADIRIYALKDGASASTVCYNMDQSVGIEASAVRNGNTIKISVKADKPCTVTLVNLSGVSGDIANTVSGNDAVFKLDGSKDFSVSI